MKIVSNVTDKILSTVFSRSAEEEAFMLECNISYIVNWHFGSDYLEIKKNNFMARCYGWGSTASKLEMNRTIELNFASLEMKQINE